MEFPAWATRIIAAWAGLGALLMTGIIPSPAWLLPYFATGLIDGTKVFIGAVITFIGVLKGLKIIKTDSAQVKTLSTTNQHLYALNPFAI